MKIFIFSLFVILSANLFVDLLDSSMSEIINERRETLEKSPLIIKHFWSQTAMNITTEQHSQLIELLEDSVEYYCDQNRLSGEMIYTIINAYSEAKLAQLRGEVM